CRDGPQAQYTIRECVHSGARKHTQFCQIHDRHPAQSPVWQYRMAGGCAGSARKLCNDRSGCADRRSVSQTGCAGRPTGPAGKKKITWLCLFTVTTITSSDLFIEWHKSMPMRVSTEFQSCLLGRLRVTLQNTALIKKRRLIRATISSSC